MRSILLHTALLSLSLVVGTASAQELTVSRLGKNKNGKDDYRYWGSSGGIAAYSFATTACNIGDVPLTWNPDAKNAPTIGSNLFRIIDGRVEHIGYSFAKYGFCSADQDGGGCPDECSDKTIGCDKALDPGCADVYASVTNDGSKGGGKWEIDPVVGTWPDSITGPTGPASIRGRLQVFESEVADPNDVYFVEGQYVSIEDHAAGNARDNWAWRPVTIAPNLIMDKAGPTGQGQPAMYAWQALANDVLVTELTVDDEGGAGVHGWMFLGSRAIDLGGGLWRYEYAVQNGNSGRGVGTFSVRVPCDGDLVLSALSFRGVRHHSGSPYSSADWTSAVLADRVEWKTDDHASDPFASAVRWGELFSFGFTANRAPAGGTAELGLFVPGTPTALQGDVIAPGGDFVVYCAANDNSTGGPALISASGSTILEQEELAFAVEDLPFDSLGYFLMSESQDFVPLFGGSQGNLCLGAKIYRFAKDVQDSGGVGEIGFAVDFDDLPGGAVFQAGDMWNFQYWYRDKNPQSTSNTTEGLSLTFCD